MSEPLTQNYQVVVEQQVTDLEMCMLILRVVKKNYPIHFDIAMEALRMESALPPLQRVLEEQDNE